MSAYQPEWPSPLFVRGPESAPGSPIFALNEIMAALQMGRMAGLALTPQQCADAYDALVALQAPPPAAICYDCENVEESLYCRECALGHIDAQPEWC